MSSSWSSSVPDIPKAKPKPKKAVSSTKPYSGDGRINNQSQQNASSICHRSQSICVEGRVVKDLKKLEVTLKDAAGDVHCLKGLAEQDPNPEQFLDLTGAVSQQIEDVRRRYCRVLRKEVATELFKLEGILETLYRYETSSDFEIRGHANLLKSVRRYNDIHFRLSPGCSAGPSMLLKAAEQQERQKQRNVTDGINCNTVCGKFLVDDHEVKYPGGCY